MVLPTRAWHYLVRQALAQTFQQSDDTLRRHKRANGCHHGAVAGRGRQWLSEKGRGLDVELIRVQYFYRRGAWVHVVEFNVNAVAAVWAFWGFACIPQPCRLPNNVWPRHARGSFSNLLVELYPSTRNLLPYWVKE